MATLSLDDADIHYEDRGSGPPLVFVHGAWTSIEAWRTQIDAFAEGYRVIALDLAGHGRSGATDRRRYTIEGFADDLEALLAHLGVDRPHLCGLSLGGMVVQEYLSRYPDGTRGAIVAGPLRSMPPVEVPAWTKPFVSPLPSLAVSLATVGTRATFRTLLASIRPINGGPWLTVDPAVRSRVLDGAGDTSPREFRNVFAALYRYDPPDLSGVTSPVLVVHGEHEVTLVKRQGERVAASVPTGRVVEVPGAGHLVNEDAPRAFNDVLGEFLDGRDVPGGRPARPATAQGRDGSRQR